MRQEPEASIDAKRLSDETRRSTVSRARRFRLCLPVWYRAVTETRWHTGVTRSVSSSGTLIRADGLGISSEPILVAIALPSSAG